MKRRLAFILLLFPISQLFSQGLQENSFVSYTRADGLSHNNITGITQDSTGYVWIATFAGLNRYNGNRFIQFHSNTDSNSLGAEEVKGMAWLDKHRLAVYTSGLHIIDTRTGSLRNLFIPYKDKQFQYKFNMIEAVRGNAAGEIFVLSRSGFYHFDKNDKLLSRFDFYTEEEVPVKHFFFGRELLDLDEQHLLIVSIDGQYIYDKLKKQVRKMLASDFPLMAEFMDYPGTFNMLYRFYQAGPGRLFVMKLESDSLIYVDIVKNRKTVSRLPFVQLRNEFHFRSRLLPVNDTTFYITGHFSGFYKMAFDPVSGIVKLDPRRLLPSFLCNALAKDKDGNLWVGTNKGVLRHDARVAQVQQAMVPTWLTDSIANMKLDDVHVTKDKVYAATRSLGGLLIFDKKSFRFDEQILFDKYRGKGNHITSLAAVGSSGLLLGTDWPLLLWDLQAKKEKLLKPPKWGNGDWTSDLYKDSRGDIWIGAYHIYRYNAHTQVFDSIPTNDRLLSVPFAIEEDRDGNIWMAGHGLTRYNTRLKKYDLLLDSFPYIRMPDRQINALLIDPNNTVWFNSNNNGLLAYDPVRRSYRQFTRNDGLPDDNIASMIVVGNKIWIACYSGIACLDIASSRIISFGKEDGFPDMPVSKGARFFYDSTARQLYMSFAGAIARFDPFEMLRKKSAPSVFIESLSINGKENTFLPDPIVTTSWRDNEIMITIGSINFSDNYSQRFAYRVVKDQETPWQSLGSQPSFSISNLSPGTHRIQVKSFSLHNRWPEQVKEISIEVLPPFWKKEWFIGVMAALAIVFIYLLIRWRTGLARKKEMQKTHIQQLKAEDYKNQFELEQISNYFSSSLADKKTEEEVLWDVVNQLISRLDYVDCMIYLWNEDKTKMIQKAAYGPKGKPEFISTNVFEVVPGQGIVGHVVQSRQPILLKDTRLDSRYRVDEEFRLSELCVPIIHNDELLGIIDSEHPRLGYFNERDIKILTTIATLIGNKLKQLESERSLEAKRVELDTINEQLAEARLEALQAQMNPHFVFNALNSIKRMILDADNEKASRYLSKFALMIRMTLDQSKDTFVTLDDNIAYLKAYLEMEQLRFNDSFSYRIDAAGNIDLAETAIPSLMIQPLAENAIWHGLMHAGGEKRISIGFTQEQQQITCTIEDNGIGIRQSEKLKKLIRPLHHSMGLENLQKRIKIMNEKFGMDCSLEITDMQEIVSDGRGTRAVLRFNVLNI